MKDAPKIRSEIFLSFATNDAGPLVGAYVSALGIEQWEFPLPVLRPLRVPDATTSSNNTLFEIVIDFCL